MRRWSASWEVRLAVGRGAACALLFVSALAALATRSEAPPVIPWAWERREDLRFIGADQTVAWYAGILTLDGDAVTVEPRRNPLRLPPKTHRIATIRIETKRAALSARQRQETVAEIRRLFRNAEELQIDFDATRSQRAFYRQLLIDLKREIPARLTITALASWCFDDRWMAALPIDEAIPMLFRMGGDEHAIRARLARGEEFADPLCRTGAGISLDESPPPFPTGRRVWVFNPEPWTGTSWQKAKSAASR